jgi:hypothetical protein
VTVLFENSLYNVSELNRNKTGHFFVSLDLLCIFINSDNIYTVFQCITETSSLVQFLRYCPPIVQSELIMRILSIGFSGLWWRCAV